MSSLIHSVSRGHNNNRIEHAEEGSDAVNHWNIGGADRLDVSYEVIFMHTLSNIYNYGMAFTS